MMSLQHDQCSPSAAPWASTHTHMQQSHWACHHQVLQQKSSTLLAGTSEDQK